MTHSAAAFNSGACFDDFLSASIGEDRKGASLSVISALARMDLDPWHAAASLAIVPAEVAQRQLASLLEAIPASTLQLASPETTARRLLALLPRVAACGPPAPAEWVGAASVAILRALLKAVGRVLRAMRDRVRR